MVERMARRTESDLVWAERTASLVVRPQHLAPLTLAYYHGTRAPFATASRDREAHVLRALLRWAV
jgi:hypothetical protein